MNATNARIMARRSHPVGLLSGKASLLGVILESSGETFGG
jgi:hypothetical protein